MDFFRSQTVETMELDGLQYVVSLSVPEQDSTGTEGANEDLPAVHFRVYLLRSKKVKGSKFPRVELEEMGPRMDLKLGRYKDADPEVLALALKKPKEKEVRSSPPQKPCPFQRNLLPGLLVIFLVLLSFALGSSANISVD